LIDYSFINCKTIYTNAVNASKMDEVESLHEYLKNSTDFFDAPASSYHHHDYKGGLLVHSIQVLESLKLIYSALNDGKLINEDIAFILAIGHDLTKCNYYNEVEKWRKVAGNKWQSYPGFDRNDTLRLGHASGACQLLQMATNLDVLKYSNIYQAIRWHMGAFVQSEMNDYSDSCRVDEYTLALHTADMQSLRIESMSKRHV